MGYETPLEEMPEVVVGKLRVAHQLESNHLVGLPLFQLSVSI